MNARVALLVIDVQVCNFEESPSIHKGGDILSKIDALVARARAAEITAHHNQVLGGWFVESREAREIEFGSAAMGDTERE